VAFNLQFFLGDGTDSFILVLCSCYRVRGCDGSRNIQAFTELHQLPIIYNALIADNSTNLAVCIWRANKRCNVVKACVIKEKIMALNANYLYLDFDSNVCIHETICVVNCIIHRVREKRGQ